MASAACIYSSVGGVHCIIMLEGKKERSPVDIKGQVASTKVYSKGEVDSPSGINIKCWCTERKKERKKLQ